MFIDDVKGSTAGGPSSDAQAAKGKWVMLRITIPTRNDFKIISV
tara:strand:- start:483 stop:614 length:132 start_codon:yes stop_codon:yes gene_type:complete